MIEQTFTLSKGFGFFVLWLCLATSFLTVSVTVGADDCQPKVTSGYTFVFEDTVVSPAANPSTCNGFRCEQPEEVATTYQLTNPACDPTQNTCGYQVRVEFKLEGNQLNQADQDDEIGSHLFNGLWFNGMTAPTCYGVSCQQISSCGQAATGGAVIDGDRVVFTASKAGSCNQIKSSTVSYLSLAVRACQTTTCRKLTKVEKIAMTGPAVAVKIGCPEDPPPMRCDASPNDCQVCMPGGVGADGGGPASGGPGDGDGDRNGDGAYMWYLAGGPGAQDTPGAAEWQVILGRNWSHDYAQRIVPDPDETHVWLITGYGSFREFSGLSSGVYGSVTPSDESRTLEYLGTGLGWELTDLDGTVVAFDDDGLWLSTTDRNGNSKTALYVGGKLDEVGFADGRTEEFTYCGAADPTCPEGRLISITSVGADGVLTRIWSYTWSGDDLVRIDRPDGTALEYAYDATHAGALTTVTLVGTDGTSERVLRAYSYDTEGRVVETWRGAADSSDAAAWDLWTYEYVAEGHTRLTDPLGKVSNRYYDTDPSSTKPRLTEIDGDCPSCGFAADSTFTYGDSSNPLLPTEVTDGNGNVTQYTYDSDGRMVSKTEAFGTAEERTTTWTYDPSYAALVASMTSPSVESGQDRETLYTRNGVGDVTLREIRGYEAGQAFDCTVGGAPCYETAMTYNSAGQVESIDPPGYGTDDVTTFTYDSTRGDLIVETRTDPLIGTTTYGHDGFQRRTSVTDVNGVVTETEYDALDRVRFVTRRGPDGAVTTDDLITEHQYNLFGDLAQTILPKGNVLRYSYDAAGRLIGVERLPASGPGGEKTSYELDAVGNRTRVDLQRWDTSVGDYVTLSSTGYSYSSRCHLDQVLHPDSTVTEYAYDCNGNLEKTWDANHPSAGKTNPATAVYAYDALDRLTSVTRPWNGAGGGNSVTTYGYDVQDHLTSVTDAEGSTTTYAYSDRDLLTQEVSPVSGTTSHAYNAHGERTQTTDARGITETRSVDELDRVTQLSYPDTTLGTTYTYGTSPAAFEVGRLTGITRDGETVTYAYDRFGRTVQDGDLTFAYDKNGNRTSVGYPGGVDADYDFDYADRQVTVSVISPVGTTDVVTSATYLPSGPLDALTFGTGASEDRQFDSRYFPLSITLDASLDRTWTYTTDAVGNPTQIVEQPECGGDLTLSNATVTTAEQYESCDGIVAGPNYTVASGGDLDLQAVNLITLADGFSVETGGTLTVGIDPTLDGEVTETYVYQDVDYFLTSASGPWGTQSWSYDRIGNRLTETDNGATDSYTYVGNGNGGNTARLSSIALSTLGTRSYAYTAAGHVDSVTAGANVVDFSWDDAGRLSQADRASDTASFLYDGRSFLRQGGDAAGPGTVLPTYDSAGLLHSLQRTLPAGTTDYHFIYLAGRPVAQVALDTGPSERWWYFTTDHLGTPTVATDDNHDELWVSSFDPFGEDPFAYTAQGASEREIFLRFPGQWDDPLWRDAMMGAEGYQNVYRWYTPSTGRYSKVDPMSAELAQQDGGSHPYAYAGSRPTAVLDPLGLFPCSSKSVRACHNQCRALRERYVGCTSIRIPIPCYGQVELHYCKCERSPCAPCPPGGPFPNVRIDRVPPSKSHWPCAGDHWHFRKYNQNPETCKCFPSKWQFGSCL